MLAVAVCDAIRARRLLVFEYGGYTRVVASYLHGFTRAGEALRAVQLGGVSRSGTFGTGKLWMVSKMSGLRLLDRAFVPDDPDYNPEDTAMVEIHCRV